MKKIIKWSTAFVLGLAFFFNFTPNLSFENGNFPEFSLKTSIGALAQENEKLYEGAPNGEINYTLMEFNEKMCGNTNTWKSWNSCEDHSYQSCPGMSFSPEPSC